MTSAQPEAGTPHCDLYDRIMWHVAIKGSDEHALRVICEKAERALTAANATLGEAKNFIAKTNDAMVAASQRALAAESKLSTLSAEKRGMEQENARLRNELSRAGFALFQVKRMVGVTDAIKAHTMRAHEQVCRTLDNITSDEQNDAAINGGDHD